MIFRLSLNCVQMLANMTSPLPVFWTCHKPWAVSWRGLIITFARLISSGACSTGTQPSASALALAQSAKEQVANLPSKAEKESQTEEEKIAAAYEALNDRFRRLYTSLPKHTAIILFSGHSDPRAMSTMVAKQNNFNRKWKSGGNTAKDILPEEMWHEHELRELQAEVHRCRYGISLFATT